MSGVAVGSTPRPLARLLFSSLSEAEAGKAISHPAGSEAQWRRRGLRAQPMQTASKQQLIRLTFRDPRGSAASQICVLYI
ncbi:hypothetical protein MHYP_G00038570 [Metynnis hypsauchen]